MLEVEEVENVVQYEDEIPRKPLQQISNVNYRPVKDTRKAQVKSKEGAGGREKGTKKLDPRKEEEEINKRVKEMRLMSSIGEEKEDGQLVGQEKKTQKRQSGQRVGQLKRKENGPNEIHNVDMVEYVEETQFEINTNNHARLIEHPKVQLEEKIMSSFLECLLENEMAMDEGKSPDINAQNNFLGLSKVERLFTEQGGEEVLMEELENPESAVGESRLLWRR